MHVQAVVEELLSEEKRMLSLYRRRAEEEADPGLRTLLQELFAALERHCRHLEESRRDLEASEQVTRQINDVYL